MKMIALALFLASSAQTEEVSCYDIFRYSEKLESQAESAFEQTHTWNDDKKEFEVTNPKLWIEFEEAFFKISLAKKFCLKNMREA